jgi:hypothetical protein
VAGINSSANNMDTTFFMADRMKKNNPIKFQQYRPSSIDESLNNVVIKSTNDSRIEEMLPNVSRHNGNKSVQM